MSKMTEAKRLSHLDIKAMHERGEKIASLTCYDFSFAKICEKAGADVLLVGDSLGMVIQGHDSTIPVKLKDMIYHTSLVAKGTTKSLIISDLPFGSYQASLKQAFLSAAELMQAGAGVVKIEGGKEMVQTTKFLSERGIAVCSHVGLTPQYINVLGSYKHLGNSQKSAEQIKADALAHEKAGAVMLLLEAVKKDLADQITKTVSIPTIGIGASENCSGQVLVLYDVLNISTGKKPRFVKNFMQPGQGSILGALETYVKSVKDKSYPAKEHLY